MTNPPDQRDSLLSPDDNRRMFDRIARRYDLLNRVLSLNLDRSWRRRAVAALAPQPARRYLDLGCGTADMTLELLRQCPLASVVGVDPAENMLAIGRHKLSRAAAPPSARLVAADAADLPFPDASFDGLISGFVLRNLAFRDRSFAQMRRVLAPGAAAVLLDLTLPTNPLLRAGHRLYSLLFLPLAGRLLAGSAAAYRYLASSVRHFPPASSILSSLASAGFSNPRALPLSCGLVTLYIASVPGEVHSS